MTFKELLQKAKKTCQEEIKLLRDKGRDYTDGNDALENFKEAARTLGTDPWLIWAVYFRKHLRAIFSFVKNKKVHSEPIRGRFQDARNYLLLGLMLLEERCDMQGFNNALRSDYYKKRLAEQVSDGAAVLRYATAPLYVDQEAAYGGMYGVQKKTNNRRTCKTKSRNRKR